MNRSLLSAVVVLSLLAATAWFLLRSPEPAQVAAGPAAENGAAALVAEPSAPSAPSSAEPVEPESERVALQAGPTGVAAVSAAARGTRGTGVTLVGQVLDGAGAPLKGARVLALSIDNPAFVGPPLDALDGDEFFGRERLEARTDAEGRFEVSGAKPGNLRLAVRAPRWAPLDKDDLLVPSGERHELGVFTLSPSPLVSGRVVDSRGRGVAGVKIGRTPPARGGIVIFGGPFSSGVPLTTTGDDGTFELDQLPAGDLRLEFRSEAHPDRSEQLAGLEAGERRAGLVVALEDGFEISGRVLGLPSSGVRELSVLAAPHREGDSGQGFELGSRESEARDAKLQADGTFTVRGLRENKQYGLTVRRREGLAPAYFAPRLSSRVVARAGDKAVQLNYQPEASLSFTVVDARTRQPVEEYRLEGGLEFPIPVLEEGGRPNHHPEGKGRVGGLRPRADSNQAQLRIQATGFKPYSREGIVVAEGQDLDLGVIALEPAPLQRVTVLDQHTGRPISGARVTLRKYEEPQANEGVMIRAAGIAIGSNSGEHEPEDFGFGSEGAVVARTDAEGVASLTSFEGERCELTVQHSEHAPYKSAPFVCAVGSPEEREVRLGEGGSVRVTLLQSDGKPVVGGKVEQRAAEPEAGGAADFFGGGNERAVTDAQGQCVFTHLAPGAHRFRPEAGSDGVFGGGNFRVAIAGMDDDSESSEWVETLVAERETAEITLVAPLRVALRGRITEGGEPLADATVALTPKREGAPRMMGMFGGGPEAKTDARGRYELSGVKAGEYEVTVTHPKRQMASEAEVEIGASDETLDLELDVAIIEGRITGPDGKPLAKVKVSAERYQPQGGRVRTAMRFAMSTDGGDGDVEILGGSDSVQVRTDDDGRYVLRGVQSGVKLVVKAESKGVQPASSEPLELAPNGIARNVDLVLAAAGRIEVSTFKDGAPAGMVLLQAYPEDGELNGPDTKTSFVQQNGKGTLDGLKPGRWKVQARQVGVDPSQSQTPPPPQTVEVRANETTPLRVDL